MKKKPEAINIDTDKARASRRKFIMNTAAGTGAVVAGLGATGKLYAGPQAAIPSITIPKEIPETMNEAPKAVTKVRSPARDVQSAVPYVRTR